MKNLLLLILLIGSFYFLAQYGERMKEDSEKEYQVLEIVDENTAKGVH
ncbi:hypothetical protein [Persicobacter diffluens]|uniref:Uncharacterized protein n=1 Tax=Persicobacter diffluens TaxID=981 RepID=A0AAN4VZC3_9BACT|nr:hypothetical protein PEDI_30800 [Persicobacter diffluens]